jgi:hypothetical protein
MASSTLIHERHIVISPTLAATIGLEEAVMLQVLHDAAHFNPAAGPWREISKEDLLRLHTPQDLRNFHIVMELHDWVDPALGKRSMELFATEVMPRVNAAIGK